MRYRHITATFILLAAVLQTAAQALTDRYNKQRPVVIVCYENPPYAFLNDNGKAVGREIDNISAITSKLGLPCKFIIKEQTEAQKAFERGEADLIITDIHSFNTSAYLISENTEFIRVGRDSVAEIHIIGKDRQLIEQIDDQYIRLRQNGDIATRQDRWLHPEQTGQKTTPMACYVAIASLLLAVVLGLICLLTLQHIRKAARNSTELSKMICQAQEMEKYYATEDNQAAHDLLFKYEAILCNPFLAISFYDNNGKLIAQNDAMKELGHTNVSNRRQPMYNAKGEIANYFVTIRCPAETT